MAGRSGGDRVVPEWSAWLSPHPALRRFLQAEQTRNDHAVDRRHFAAIDGAANGVRPEWRASSQSSWELDVCWLPRAAARALGPFDDAVFEHLGVRPRRGRAPLLVHPQGR